MDILFYIGIAFFVLFGPWILLWRVNTRRRSERLEDQSRWADITARIHTLERGVMELRVSRTTPIGAQVPKKETAVEPVSATTYPQPVPHKVAEPARTPAQTVAEAWVTSSSAPSPAIPPASTPPPPPAPPTTASAPPTAPRFTVTEAGPSWFDRFKSSIDVEEMLGTDWLNKLGIVLLVLGIAFFLSYELKTMGPGGKVLVGFLTAAVLLAAGIWFERGDRYRILARAGIGGGWALLFFTTYAMYHVPAAHVL